MLRMSGPEASRVFLWSLFASLRASCDSLGMQVAFPDFSGRQATPQLLPSICKQHFLAAATPDLQSLPKIYLEHFGEFLHENLRMKATLLYFGCKKDAKTILGCHGGLFGLSTRMGVLPSQNHGWKLFRGVHGPVHIGWVVLVLALLSFLLPSQSR